MIVNRPLPFSDGQRSSSASVRRGRNGSGADDSESNHRTIVASHEYVIQAFRVLCRAGQLQLAEQLALANLPSAGGSRKNGVGKR